MPLDGSEFKFEIDETTKVLIEGRRRIETSWWQASPGQRVPQGGHCAVLAISRQNIGDLTMPALLVLARAADLGDPTHLPRWNDDPKTTQADVLNAYDIAISASLSGSAYP